MQNQPWIFGDFWKALNSAMTKKGLPELGFKDAREIWENAQNEATKRAWELANPICLTTTA